MGSSASIFKRKKEVPTKKPNNICNQAEEIKPIKQGLFASIFRRRTKETKVNSMQLSAITKDRRPSVVDDFKLERSFSLHSPAKKKNGSIKPRLSKTNIKLLSAKEKDEEEMLRDIFLNTLNTINIKPEVEKVLTKKEKKRHLTSLKQEMETQKEHIEKGAHGGELKLNQKLTVSEEIEILNKLVKKRFSSSKTEPTQNSKNINEDSKPQIVPQVVIGLSTMKTNPRKSLLMSPTDQSPKISKEIQFADLKNKFDEVIQAPRKSLITVINRREQGNGLIRIHDKTGLAKVQKDLIDLRSSNKQLSALPSLNAKSKKKNLQILEDNHSSFNSNEPKCLGDILLAKKSPSLSAKVSPTSHPLKRLATFIKDDDISPSKQTCSTLPFNPTSPSACESPNRFASQLFFLSPTISPNNRLINLSSLSLNKSKAFKAAIQK